MCVTRPPVVLQASALLRSRGAAVLVRRLKIAVLGWFVLPSRALRSATFALRSLKTMTGATRVASRARPDRVVRQTVFVVGSGRAGASVKGVKQDPPDAAPVWIAICSHRCLVAASS